MQETCFGAVSPLEKTLYTSVTGGRPQSGLIWGMRFFFNIADRYGVSADGIGHECAEQDATVQHACQVHCCRTRQGQ
ncbi:hypothetical protein AS156_29905 [Bradyrhizobium macuxiense]|uniref:Uncharacterized protein n=1 Tax=Bradyrhizobium macuxiense TaxID=1755647 RepID=A0A109K3J9_9BRAD|nr:hypothetical protein AS156_29905 [Bradyrhizobium macuxiense]